jgi:superfamily II DNA or RNA helicase
MNDFRNIMQTEAIQIGLQYNQCTLQIPMRGGKSYIGLQIAKSYNKVLVSYPNKSIQQSWIDDSIKFSIDISHIIFTTHISLNKHDLNNFDLVILDEIQDVSLDKWNYIAINMPKKLIGLTGTPPNKGEKLTFLNTYCPIKYKKTLDETTGKTNKNYKIVVHLLEPDNKANIKLKSGKSWSEKAKITFFENKYRETKQFQIMLQLIQTIQNSSTKLNYLKQLCQTLPKSLIFLETTKQCDELPYSSYHSKNKNSKENLEDFQSNSNHLTCVKQLSAGITFKQLNTCVILHCYSSNSKASQRLARCLNYVEGENAIIHIIGLNNTIDLKWIENGLNDFDKSKIIYKNIN